MLKMQIWSHFSPFKMTVKTTRTAKNSMQDKVSQYQQQSPSWNPSMWLSENLNLKKLVLGSFFMGIKWEKISKVCQCTPTINTASNFKIYQKKIHKNRGKKVLFISWPAHSILVLENQGDNFCCIICADSAATVQLLHLQIGCKAR